MALPDLFFVKPKNKLEKYQNYFNKQYISPIR